MPFWCKISYLACNVSAPRLISPWTLAREHRNDIKLTLFSEISETAQEIHKNIQKNYDKMNTSYRKIIKRSIDIIGSVGGLIILGPVIAIITWLVYRKLGRPVFFRQIRPGLNGRPFEMVKFRTMRDAVDKDGTPLSDADRMTSFGRFLRSSSLDELPEIWNVLKGDMSLVGPRPLLMEYLSLYTPEQARRHELRPGITGWAQVSGRNSITWEDKFKADLWYIDNQSLWLDLKILILTINKVIRRDGISADNHITMPKFTRINMSTNNNIIILSAGRRVELVHAFKDAIKKHFPEGRVYTTDIQPELSAACQVSDGAFKVVKADSDDYIDSIIDVCENNSVGMVIPTIDTELQILSINKHRFESKNIAAIVSSVDLIKKCRDKRLTSDIYRKLKMDQPTIYDKENISYPCFCKPYDGSCSIGIYTIHNDKMLTHDMLNNDKNMFMELIGKEYDEYTIDAFYNRNGKLCCLVPRERIEVRGGEISKGVTRKNYVYEYLRPRLSNLEGACGCVTVQVFANPESKNIKALEINPRFGGGFPLAHAAGANYPDWLIREYFLNEEISFYDDWEDNLLMLRYDAKVIVHEN